MRAFFGERHRLMAFILWLVRDPHVASDIFQEVWLCFNTALEEDRPIEDCARWSRGVARNLIRQHWRRQRGDRVVVDSALIDTIELAFEENPAAGREDWFEALNACLARLPSHTRQALALKYEDSATIDEIARTTRRSAEAVVKAFVRTRRFLRTCIERRLACERASS